MLQLQTKGFLSSSPQCQAFVVQAGSSHLDWAADSSVLQSEPASLASLPATYVTGYKSSPVVG